MNCRDKDISVAFFLAIRKVADNVLIATQNAYLGGSAQIIVEIVSKALQISLRVYRLDFGLVGFSSSSGIYFYFLVVIMRNYQIKYTKIKALA